ncbi:MAG: GHKL domain-containing protein [Oscillospiraceae bacterium]|nr:GHKL domain-containing protein [Oscillospiraceae bacterium]
MSIIQTVSNIIMVFASTALIRAFGISKYRGKKYIFISAAVNLFFTAVTFALHEFNLNTVSIAVYLMMYFSAFHIVFGEIKLSHFYIAIMSDCITSLLSSCFYIMIENLIRSDCYDTKTAALLSVRLVLLLTALNVNRYEKVRRIHLTIKIIPKHIFILTTMSVLFISLLAENNSFTAESSVKQIINALLIAALTVSLTAIIFSLLISVVSKKQIADTNIMLKNMVDTQLRHYKILEKLNNDIRAFRHDYINHVRSISSLLEMKQYDDAIEYTGKLINASPVNNFSFQTGNNLADAILTDKNDLCGESAKIIFYGFIPDKIDNSDLCVILSNSLDNAAEACADCEGHNLIEVCAQERQGYFVLTVRNPTSDQRTYNSIPDTIKPDALNHGFGLRNIEAIVKKYDGHLSIKCENKVFELSLTFKL